MAARGGTKAKAAVAGVFVVSFVAVKYFLAARSRRSEKEISDTALGTSETAVKLREIKIEEAATLEQQTEEQVKPREIKIEEAATLESNRKTPEEQKKEPRKFIQGGGIEVEILYEDELILVVNKPSGLLVHCQGYPASFTLVKWLKQYKPDIQPRPAHRLDAPTSGVLIMAKSKPIAVDLQVQFREHRVQKTYLALVRGWTEDAGTINVPLRKQDSDLMLEASTSYRCLDKREYPWPTKRHATSRFSLLELRPSSGRFHQIRRHLARIGHPIVGDTSHGDTRTNHLFISHTSENRLQLHARRIEFLLTEQKRVFTAPVTGFLAKWLEEIDYHRHN